jgi:hypothetical protein
MSGPLSSNLGAVLFLATLLTGVLSLVYPRRFTTWPPWILIHLPLAVVFLFRAYLGATFIPGDAIRLDVVLLFPVVCLSLAVYVRRLLKVTRDLQACPPWRRRGKANVASPSCEAKTEPNSFLLARGLGLGLGSGFLSAFVWDVSMTMPKTGHGFDALLVGLLLDLLPGMLYGLAVWILLARDLPDRRWTRLAATAMAGGITFLIAFLITGVSYAALYGISPLLGGLIGSVLFGKIASRLLRPNRAALGLVTYVLSGTVAALAFFPFCSCLVRGPETPALHWSLYLGFMVWQGATAATIGLSLPAAKAKADSLEEV